MKNVGPKPAPPTNHPTGRHRQETEQYATDNIYSSFVQILMLEFECVCVYMCVHTELRKYLHLNYHSMSECSDGATEQPPSRAFIGFVRIMHANRIYYSSFGMGYLSAGKSRKAEAETIGSNEKLRFNGLPPGGYEFGWEIRSTKISQRR